MTSPLNTTFGYTYTVPKTSTASGQQSVDLVEFKQLLMQMKKNQSLQSDQTPKKKATLGTAFRGAVDVYSDALKGNTLPLLGSGTSSKLANTLISILMIEMFPFEMLRQAVIQDK